MARSGMGSSRRTRAFAVALAAAALSLSAFASAAQALPASFWGIVPQATPTEEQSLRLQRGGVRSMRVPISWGGVEIVRGAADWTATDALVRAAAAGRMEILPFVTGAPEWAVPSVWVPGSGRTVKAPARLPASGAAAGAWSSFLAQVVGRYGPNGVFWAENPTLPRRSVRTWQIWNEPNFKYFVAKPNPAEYGKLLKLSYGAIKAVDRGAKVILGGMFSYPKGGGAPGAACARKTQATPSLCAPAFLGQMYKKTPGVKSKFDGVALHPYTATYQQLPAYIEDFLDVLDENNDSATPLWLTELGWSSKKPTPGNSFAKGLGGQATQLRGSFALLKASQAKWKLQRVYWFSVDDQAGSCNFCDGSGLFADGFRPKKAWFEYVKFAGGRP
jgi:hypothetical protein